jgi:hypothetical protein
MLYRAFSSSRWFDILNRSQNLIVGSRVNLPHIERRQGVAPCIGTCVSWSPPRGCAGASNPGLPEGNNICTVASRTGLLSPCDSFRLASLTPLNIDRLKKKSICYLTSEQSVSRMEWSASQQLRDTTEIRTGCGEKYLRQARTVRIMKQKCDTY